MNVFLFDAGKPFLFGVIYGNGGCGDLILVTSACQQLYNYFSFGLDSRREGGSSVIITRTTSGARKNEPFLIFGSKPENLRAVFFNRSVVAINQGKRVAHNRCWGTQKCAGIQRPLRQGTYHGLVVVHFGLYAKCR